MYENQDALTKFLPAGYDGLIKYVDVGGRMKLSIRDHVTDYIPNPTSRGSRCPVFTGST